jgi:hypothetical protein
LQLAILLCYYAEAAAIVPHGPAYVVLLKGFTDVADPVSAVAGAGSFAVDAEFVAEDRNVPAFGPSGYLVEFCIDSLSVPVVGTVADYCQALYRVGVGFGRSRAQI